MKLSTKGRYGIRAMYSLALSYGEGPQTVKTIAERQNIPEAYLEQLIARLRKAGLVTSVRGAQGGYLLSDKPQNISIGAILRAAEGPLAQVSCVLKDEEEEHAAGCAMHILWSRIYVGVNDLLNDMTLGDMVEDTKTVGEGCACCKC